MILPSALREIYLRIFKDRKDLEIVVMPKGRKASKAVGCSTETQIDEREPETRTVVQSQSCLSSVLRILGLAVAAVLVF